MRSSMIAAALLLAFSASAAMASSELILNDEYSSAPQIVTKNAAPAASASARATIPETSSHLVLRNEFDSAPKFGGQADSASAAPRNGSR